MQNALLIASASVFLLAHLGLSFHPVRSRAIAKLGEGGFAGAYSAIVGLAFAGIVVGWIYRTEVPVWTPPPFTRWIPFLLMPFALFFSVAGFTSKNPTVARQEEAAKSEPRGVVTITRHPALWGFALWGLSHLATNGDVASIVLSSSIALLALLGMLHIDSRRARALGSDWDAFARKTSIVPFAAILGRRARLDVSGLWWRALIALGLYALLALTVHNWVFGVSPLPYELTR
jgi:uncharacterized membrane protein